MYFFHGNSLRMKKQETLYPRLNSKKIFPRNSAFSQWKKGKSATDTLIVVGVLT